MMSIRLIHCQKLKKELEGLPRPPYPGEMGKRLYENISKEAWQLWLKRQTMFINEYRLILTEQSAKDFLRKEMEKFLFEDSDNKPEGFTPIQKTFNE
jgi:Fe-S cluster biosynthesis and repair protein YggX